MKGYYVNVREVHCQPYFVEAETPEDAIRIVADGGGAILEDGFVYCHTLEPDEWTVEETEDFEVDEEGNYIKVLRRNGEDIWRMRTSST